MIRRILHGFALILAWIVALGAVVWAVGALHYDFPVLKGAAPWLFVLAMGAAVVFVRGRWLKVGAVFAGFGVVLGWWLTLQPTNEADWQADVARLPWAEREGDEVTLHNVRNVQYRTEMDYTPQWETRKVRLSQITGIDIAMNYWGSPWIAHPILSFQFADAPPVCFSIETRKRKGQTYSAISGLFRQFALIYVVADERDVLRVRTNYRHGEDVYLYRATVQPAEARERFLEYLHSINALRAHPRWYNAVTTNCTTSIRHQHPARERVPWDWRMLLNGKMDELMSEHGTIVSAGLPFAELKERSLIDAAAKRANDSPDFSSRIRAGLPFLQR